MDLFRKKPAAFLLHKTLIDGLERCELLVDYCVWTLI